MPRRPFPILRAVAAGLALCVAAGGGGLAATPPPGEVPATPAASATPAAPECHSASASIAFDFDGAAAARCVVEGEREFALVIGPEHAPPINPSPWYAFRYRADPGAPLAVHLEYLAAKHRYAPKWRGAGDASLLATTVAANGSSATLTLPPGSGVVSAQELFTGSQYADLLAALGTVAPSARLVLGASWDGRPIEAVRLGDPAAPRLVILLGRQHPPEVTGAIAMDAFLTRIAELVRDGTIDPAQTQFLIVPLLNPDGVARGHWRANLGGKDLNRDWGEFSQPETRAVKTWLDALPANVRPVAMVDFHSTQRNLFYVQGEDETTPTQEAFLARWLGSRVAALPGYPFTIERRNANPGSGTAKNWFNETYRIPSYTYEIGDDADRDATRAAARTLADGFVTALAELP